ncbi:MAG: potassium transporter TrkG [Eubacteriales bacterium]|nr:potassium transporter TrkG [Eubacteriales bacterium]
MPLLRVKKKQSRFFEWFLDNPGRMIVASFALIILLGTLLLILPISSNRGQWTNPAEALFTATSATCVTGLVVHDTASYFSSFGQVVILLLIQIGGLGLATLMGFVLSFRSQSSQWKTMAITQASTAAGSMTEAMTLVRHIMAITLSFEGIATLYFSYRFYPIWGAKAIWRALFHSVSSFCNAGFDLNGSSDSPFVSLTAYNQSPDILLLTAFLFIAGGLGFVVWLEIFRWPKRRKFSFHAKLILSLTLIFLLVSTLLVAGLEWHNHSNSIALGSLPVHERPTAAFFQAASLRTAGFNSIDQASLSEPTKLMSSFFMFVGAAPAGTGGGVKLSTFAVIFAMLVSNSSRRKEVRVRRYLFEDKIVRSALTVISLSLILIFVSLFLLMIFETSALKSGRFGSIDLLYEVSSAFGTVGLSSLGTPNLSLPSRLVLIICMFLGRVGPASFAVALVRPPKKEESDRVLAPAETLVG